MGRICNRPPHILVHVILSSRCTLMLQSCADLVIESSSGKWFRNQTPTLCLELALDDVDAPCFFSIPLPLVYLI